MTESPVNSRFLVEVGESRILNELSDSRLRKIRIIIEGDVEDFNLVSIFLLVEVFEDPRRILSNGCERHRHAGELVDASAPNSCVNAASNRFICCDVRVI